MDILSSKILFVYFFGIMHVSKMQDIRTLYEESVTELQAAKSLNKIQSSDALPLILFEIDNEFQSPRSLNKVVTVDGKMAQGTNFKPAQGDLDPMFFCAKENSTKKCLIERNFLENQTLRCDAEATPILITSRSNENCGSDDHFMYGFGYNICDEDEVLLSSNGILLYGFCYNKKSQKTSFTVHSITSTGLLNSKLLFRERNVNYNMRDDFTLPKNEAEVESTSQHSTNNLGYKLQKLVPPEDMAFALWRKTTFQLTNTAWQLEKLSILWDEIGEYIRYEAKRKSTNDFAVYTGVFDIDLSPEHNTDAQLPNIWVKLIYNVKNYTSMSVPISGIAILMNNFTSTKVENSDESSNPREEAIKQFCDQNLCLDSLINKFKDIGGQIRCCPLTEKIWQLFYENDIKDLDVLEILNVTRNREILYNVEDLTRTEAAVIVEKIQPNEILPVVLCLQLDTNHYTPIVPVDIYKIEIEDKKIVKGSEFLSQSDQKYNVQILFCPKKDSDEKCLEQIKLDESNKQLQCIEEPTPVIRKSPIRKNNCGANGSGILYEVVYEICPSERYQIKEIKFYELCYDAFQKEILYTNHRIMSPKLLFSNVLIREQTMQYQITEDDKLPLFNIQELKDAASSMESRQEPDNESILTASTTKSNYKLQKLVPSEDMAFASWRKTTFAYVNTELQHETLMPLWNDIDRYIRDAAYTSYIEQMKYTDNYEGYSIYTGVFDINSMILGNYANDPKSSTWVKVIYNEDLKEPEGIVIFMNNFLTTSEIDQPEESYSIKNKNAIIENNCKPDLCVEELKNEFEKIKGWIRCCALTTTIGQLLGIPNVATDAKILKIRYINTLN